MIALKNLDAIKTTLIRAIQKIAEVTGDLIGSKIADEITGASKKKSLTRLQNDDANNETEALKKDTHLQNKDNKLLMN